LLRFGGEGEDEALQNQALAGGIRAEIILSHTSKTGSCGAPPGLAWATRPVF